MNHCIESKVIAVLSDIPAEAIVSVAETVVNCGIDCICVNLGRHDSVKAILYLTKHYGDKIIVGAGNVTSPVEVETVSDKGAKFISSNITDRSVIERAREMGIISIAGAFTPTEINLANSFGADYVKLYPCKLFSGEYLGTLIKSMPQIKLIAGDISSNLAAEYLSYGASIVESERNFGCDYKSTDDLIKACNLLKNSIK